MYYVKMSELCVDFLAVTICGTRRLVLIWQAVEIRLCELVLGVTHIRATIGQSNSFLTEQVGKIHVRVTHFSTVLWKSLIIIQFQVKYLFNTCSPVGPYIELYFMQYRTCVYTKIQRNTFNLRYRPDLSAVICDL